jgi:sialic acid synthase SpsE
MIFVVAEIGVNWDGDFELAEDMMINAKKGGCDAVKFQAFNENLVKKHPEAFRLIKSAISKSNIEIIDGLSKTVGIEWFCTPMYPEAVDVLEPFVKRYKIRGADGEPLLENKRSELFERILKTDKEIIVSSQISPCGTIHYDNPKIKWLYSVPKYPCDLAELDFRNLKDFDGYSNHCPNYIAPLTAAIMGSKIIEIHITADKSKNFVDNNVSFDYNELKKLVESIRLSEKIIK